MIEHGYSMNKYYNCVYHWKINDGSFIYFLLYVDDILIAAKYMCEVERSPQTRVWDKRFGSNEEIWRMKIHRSGREENLFLSQKKYIEKVLEKFGMLDAKPVKTHLLLIFYFQQICLLKPIKRRSICLMFPMLVQLKVLCLLYCALDQTFTCTQCRKSIYGHTWKRPLASSEMNFAIFKGIY